MPAELEEEVTPSAVHAVEHGGERLHGTGQGRRTPSGRSPIRRAPPNGPVQVSAMPLTVRWRHGGTLGRRQPVLVAFPRGQRSRGFAAKLDQTTGTFADGFVLLRASFIQRSITTSTTSQNTRPTPWNTTDASRVLGPKSDRRSAGSRWAGSGPAVRQADFPW